jgi:hypothetical protein
MKGGGVDTQCLVLQHNEIALISGPDINILKGGPRSGPCLIADDFPTGRVQQNEVKLRGASAEGPSLPISWVRNETAMRPERAKVIESRVTHVIIRCREQRVGRILVLARAAAGLLSRPAWTLGSPAPKQSLRTRGCRARRPRHTRKYGPYKQHYDTCSLSPSFSEIPQRMGDPSPNPTRRGPPFPTPKAHEGTVTDFLSHKRGAKAYQRR